MKKLSDHYFKNLPITHVQFESPQRKYSHKNRSTRIFKPIEQTTDINFNREPIDYYQAHTPQKRSVTLNDQNSTFHKKYSNIKRTPTHYKTTFQKNINRSAQLQCNNHSQCRQNLQQMNGQLTKILSLIQSSRNLNDFHCQQNQTVQKVRIKEQMYRIDNQNKRLVSLLHQLQSKMNAGSNCPHQFRVNQLEEQVQAIKSQLGKTISECDRQYQALYQTNQTLSSRLHSVEDRNIILQKQVESLRYLLRQKQQQILRKQQQTQRKTNTDKISVSLIRQQYNNSIKMLGQSLSMKISQANSKNEIQLSTMRNKYDKMQKKLRQTQNNLVGLNDRIQSRQQIKELVNKINSHEDNLCIKDKQIKNYKIEINGYLSQIKQLQYKIQHQNNQQNSEKQQRIRQLVQNYEQQIKILKKQNQYKSSKNQEQMQIIQQHNRQLLQKIANLQQQLNKTNQDNHRARSNSISLAEYRALQKKKNDISTQLADRLLQISSLRSVYDQMWHKNQKYQQQIAQLSHQIQLSTNHHSQKDTKISELQITIYNINKMMEQLEIRIDSYQKQKNNLQQIDNQLSNLKIQHQQMLELLQKQRIQKDKQLGELKDYYYRQIQSEIRRQLEKSITQKIFMEYTQANAPIKQELKQLKQLIKDGNYQKLSIQFQKISQLYHQQLINSEQYQIDIQKSKRMIIELRNDLQEAEKLKLVFQQKAKLLTANNIQLQTELKNRKQQYAILLSQKSILQKQIHLLKQQKLDKTSIQLTKARAKQITSKIQKLLNIQKQRCQSSIFGGKQSVIELISSRKV